MRSLWNSQHIEFRPVSKNSHEGGLHPLGCSSSYPRHGTQTEADTNQARLDGPPPERASKARRRKPKERLPIAGPSGLPPRGDGCEWQRALSLFDLNFRGHVPQRLIAQLVKFCVSLCRYHGCYRVKTRASFFDTHSFTTVEGKSASALGRSLGTCVSRNEFESIV